MPKYIFRTVIVKKLCDGFEITSGKFFSVSVFDTLALAGTVALDAFALTQGAAFLRVHDVLEAVQTVKLFMKTF